MVEGSCARARQFAERLERMERAEVLNDVGLDQVLVRFRAGSAAAGADPAADDAVTRRVIEALQASGECWMSGTTWRGHAAMRISVVNWQTTEADVDRSITAVERALASG
jgi:glutamate/tyrosine decarboxylase-like PLP-dependent enzyme